MYLFALKLDSSITKDLIARALQIVSRPRWWTVDTNVMITDEEFLKRLSRERHARVKRHEDPRGHIKVNDEGVLIPPPAN